MEVELQGSIYRIDRMDVFDQWDVTRRLMPVLGSMKDVKDNESLSQMLMPAFQSLAVMSNEDMHFVLNKCLSVVMRKQELNGTALFSKVLSASNKLMFDDINMVTMIRLTIFVIVENMGNFFTQAALEDSIAAAMPK